VKGNRNEEIHDTGVPVTIEPFSDPFSEIRSEESLPLVFPSMNDLLKRSFIASQSPCHCKISFPGQTRRAGMGPGFFGNKRAAANGTEGRFDPADPGQTIRTDSLLLFF
jgi:hypothetical protein